MNEAKIGFELRKIQVPLSDILPVRQLNDPAKTVLRYQAILVSIKAVGLMEPLMVYPQKDAPGKYLLLDGHLRRFALKELGHTTADCIIAADDECFTYNARVSRIAPIQEHRMILKAVNLGGETGADRGRPEHSSARRQSVHELAGRHSSKSS